jgi:hypothetical protein
MIQLKDFIDYIDYIDYKILFLTVSVLIFTHYIKREPNRFVIQYQL